MCRARVHRTQPTTLSVYHRCAAVKRGAAGAIVSTALRGFHATLLGLALGPIDTVFTTTGLLMLAGGFYAMVNLRDINPLQP